MAYEIERDQASRTPKFSIIIAVYNTAALLSECFDSLLSQTFDSFEIIAVDDASTDESLGKLQNYATCDPRVKIVHLESNVGSGPARNAGLAQACGEYVWFVDSDDWIERRSLATIVKRLNGSDLDVLLFGWLRHLPGEVVEPCVAMVHLHDAPKVFALHEWARATQILHTPWNKVVRRNLIKRVGFQFAPGKYQDLPYSYSMLAAANRIGTLPDALVHYRKDRADSAMSTMGEEHLAVLEQWDYAFSLMVEHSPEPEIIRPALFDRMVWHLLLVIQAAGRVPREHWAAYHTGVQNLWAAHAPADYQFPRGLMGLRYLMLAGHLPFASLIPRAAILHKKARRFLSKLRH